MEYQNTRKLNGVNKFVPSWQPLLWLLESSSSEREWAFQVHRVNEQHIPQWTSDPWPRLPPSVMLSWSHPPGKGLPPQWLLGDFGRPNLSSQHIDILTDNLAQRPFGSESPWMCKWGKPSDFNSIDILWQFYERPQVNTSCPTFLKFWPTKFWT